MDQPFHSQVTTGGQNVKRPNEIRLGNFDRMEIGIRDGDQRPQVQNHLAICNGTAYRLRIPQIASDNFNRRENLRG